MNQISIPNPEPQPVSAMKTIDLSKETVGRAVEVATGFWMIATQHQPGGSRMFPQINNRCLVFRLVEAGEPLLLVINGVESSAIAEVKRIEQETNLGVRYVLSAGGGHHVLLPPWVEAFPRASVLVGPDRIPRTQSGRQLLEMPGVSTLNPDDVLPQFRGQLEFVSFRGLWGAPDNRSPGEGGSDGFLMMLNFMVTMLFRMNDPVDELWTFHVPSQTIIGGENLGWMYPAAQHARLPAMLKRMIQANAVYLFTDARRVGDAKLVDASWRKILTWPARTLLTYHDPAGHGFYGDVQAALVKAVRANRQLID